jgi:osmotically inducible protein OsmC
MGGPGGKTNPEELFAAGYAACFHSAVKRVAAENKVSIGKSTVEANVAIGCNDSENGFEIAVDLHVILPGADVQAAKDGVRGAHMICPYSNGTRNNIGVMLSVTPAEAREGSARSSAFHHRLLFRTGSSTLVSAGRPSSIPSGLNLAIESVQNQRLALGIQRASSIRGTRNGCRRRGVTAFRKGTDRLGQIE